MSPLIKKLSVVPLLVSTFITLFIGPLVCSAQRRPSCTDYFAPGVCLGKCNDYTRQCIRQVVYQATAELAEIAEDFKESASAYRRLRRLSPSENQSEEAVENAVTEDSADAEEEAVEDTPQEIEESASTADQDEADEPAVTPNDEIASSEDPEPSVAEGTPNEESVKEEADEEVQVPAAEPADPVDQETPAETTTSDSEEAEEDSVEIDSEELDTSWDLFNVLSTPGYAAYAEKIKETRNRKESQQEEGADDADDPQFVDFSGIVDRLKKCVEDMIVDKSPECVDQRLRDPDERGASANAVQGAGTEEEDGHSASADQGTAIEEEASDSDDAQDTNGRAEGLTLSGIEEVYEYDVLDEEEEIIPVDQYAAIYEALKMAEEPTKTPQTNNSQMVLTPEEALEVDEYIAELMKLELGVTADFDVYPESYVSGDTQNNEVAGDIGPSDFAGTIDNMYSSDLVSGVEEFEGFVY